MELELPAMERTATVSIPPRYSPVRTLGRGGAGSVVLARDQRLDRLVALKLLDRLDPPALERFRREARIAARLRSRSIVKVHEFDEWRGRPYLVMEYVEGGNLSERQLDLPALLGVVREIALALAHAHDQGVIHRDIKPENILVDRAGRAYLTDFGLARDEQCAWSTAKSGGDGVSGTPYFMSPEQVRGEAADARSDVYSLGATLFARIGGRRPFEGDTLVDVLYAVMRAEPPRLDALRTDVPPALERLVARCLEKEPRRRFATMRELVRAIDAVLAPEPSRWTPRALASRLLRRTSEARASVAGATPPDRTEIDRWMYGAGSHVHLLDGLEGLDARLAGERPCGFPNSIFQIVEHMRFWQRIALARIRREPYEYPEHAEGGWPAAVRPKDDEEWQASLRGLASELRELESFFESAFEPLARDLDVASRAREQIRMVTGHNSYHLGQIVTLRRQLGAWPPPKGGETW